MMIAHPTFDTSFPLSLASYPLTQPLTNTIHSLQLIGMHALPPPPISPNFPPILTTLEPIQLTIGMTRSAKSTNDNSIVPFFTILPPPSELS